MTVSRVVRGGGEDCGDSELQLALQSAHLRLPLGDGWYGLANRGTIDGSQDDPDDHALRAPGSGSSAERC